jgi:uncharacterized protein
MLKDMLDYQEVDMKLYKVENEIQNSDFKKTANNMVQYVKDSQSKILSLEEQAKKFSDDYENTLKEYNDLIAESQDLSNININDFDNDKLNEFVNKVNDVNSKLNDLQKTMISQKDTIDKILKSFEVAKSNNIKARQQYKISKDAFESFENDKTPIINDYKKQLQEIAKKVEPELMEKYKKLRTDRILPAFVEVNGNNCGGCSTELSVIAKEKLAKNKMYECEHCRRVIYTKD